MKNKTKSFITTTITSAFLMGCSSFATYRPITDDTLTSKPANCEIPISRESLKNKQRQVGEITVTRGGIAANVRSNVTEKEAREFVRKQGCKAGVDGVAEFRELRIEHAAQDIQWEGKGYVQET